MDYLKDLHDMCDTLSRELSSANDKIRQNGGTLSGADLDYVDKLTHAIKSIKTTIAMIEAEDGYSNRMYPMYHGSYRDGNSYNYGNSYEYSRRGAKRDSMGRYSRGYSMDDGMVSELKELMHDAPNEQVKQDFQRLIDKIERM